MQYKDPFTPIHALADVGSAASFISLAQIKSWNISYTQHRENFILADRRTFQSVGSTKIKCQVEDTQISINFRVVPFLSSKIILGRDTLRYLPIRLYYGERLLFSGHQAPVLTPRSQPELPVGEGIRNFSKDPLQRKVVYDTLIRHKEVVSQWSTTPGLIRDAAFRIPTGDAKPIYRPAIPLSQKHQSLLQTHLDDYRARGMVRPSSSPWGATTFLVPKAGTTEMRTCHDYRPLNKITERHQYPMPSARQLLGTIGTKNKFFAKVDLRWGYNQIPIQHSDIPKTAITSPCGHDEWLVMNFGFTDAPAFFQSTIEKIVGDTLNKGAVVYLDDILIYAETFEEFQKTLDTVLMRLNAAGAKIHIGKSDFLPETLTYLGMVFSEKGVQHLPERVKKLNNHPAPETVKALRSFLGFANYFRPYIPKFAQYEGQLRQLPDHNFFYNTKDTQAFEALRSAVSSDSVLAPFDPSLPIQLHVDASGNGLGAILCQLHSKNTLRVVAYASRLLSDVERRYTNTERELLAIEWAVCEQFRLQLTGLYFEVHTDHSALVHECRLKQPTSRIHRMLLKLDAFDCKIIYKPGILNAAADFLSRLSDEQISHSQPNAICSISNIERQLVEPQNRRSTIYDYHVNALHHFGLKKTYDAISQRFYWPGMARDIKTFIQDCPQCQHFNTAKKPQIAVSPILSTQPKDILNIDIVGPLPNSFGKRYIIIAIDHYTKYGFADAFPKIDGSIVRDFVKNIFIKHGAWKTVITDNAKVFTGKAFESILLDWNVKSQHISPRHPEANGNAERFIRTLRQLLRKNSQPSNWSEILHKMVLIYNRAKHSATSVTPIEVFLDKPATFSIDTKHQVSLKTIRSPTGVDQYRATYARAAVKWVPGTQVWHVPRQESQLKSGLHHFEPTRLGPYKVIGPASRKQHLLVTDGHYNWPLPTWELIN